MANICGMMFSLTIIMCNEIRRRMNMYFRQSLIAFLYSVFVVCLVFFSSSAQNTYFATALLQDEIVACMQFIQGCETKGM